jgi:hypothetical protein
MLVIGLHPIGNTRDSTVTVVITDRLKHSNTAQKAAAAFTIDSDVLQYDAAAVEARIAEALSWEAMAGPG